jgi:hypothetical protein
VCEEVSFCKIMPCSSLLEEIRSEFVVIVTTLGLCHFVAAVATAEENTEGLFVSVPCTATHFTPSNFCLLHAVDNNTRKVGTKILNKTDEMKVIMQVIT